MALHQTLWDNVISAKLIPPDLLLPSFPRDFQTNGPAEARKRDLNVNISKPTFSYILKGTALDLTHRPGQNGRHFPDDIFRCNFLKEKFCVLTKISLKFVFDGPINNNPALV